MEKNVFKAGNLIFVKNSMGARVYVKTEDSSIGRRKFYFDDTNTHLPCRHPVVFLDKIQDSFGRNFLRVIGPDGICYIRKEAFL